MGSYAGYWGSDSTIQAKKKSEAPGKKYRKKAIDLFVVALFYAFHPSGDASDMLRSKRNVQNDLSTTQQQGTTCSLSPTGKLSQHDVKPLLMCPVKPWASGKR